MKCLMCESLSLAHICTDCQERLLKPSLSKRQLPCGVQVISFYKYKDIKELLHTKHTDLGYYIYTILSNLSLKKFATGFELEEKVFSLAIDDNIQSGYSHTAILNNSLESHSIKPLHSKLRATKNISYSGKTLQYRKNNPREFQMKKFKGENIILVDDIITTGTTLCEAVGVAKKEGKEVLFCLTLADAR